jgi:phosphoglycolate phosphatase-like HAD superfamily hydrolase
LDTNLDLNIAGFGSDARDRFKLPAIIAQRFAARYGRPLDPSHTVVVGDAPNDIACARHAGFRVVAVAHRIDRHDLAQCYPDAILDDLTPDVAVATIKALIQGSSESTVH